MVHARVRSCYLLTEQKSVTNLDKIDYDGPLVGVSWTVNHSTCLVQSRSVLADVMDICFFGNL